MSRQKTPRCAACRRRVRRNHPYTLVVGRKTGKETFYHCRPDCQKKGIQQSSAQQIRDRDVLNVLGRGLTERALSSEVG